MNVEIGSRVLRLSQPYGQAGEIKHVDGDTCWVVWADGKAGSIDRNALCGYDNVAQLGAAKKTKKRVGREHA